MRQAIITILILVCAALLAIMFDFIVIGPAGDLGKAQELFDLTNSERKTKLIYSECLSQQAYERAKDMVEQGYFSHQDPLTGEDAFTSYVENCPVQDIVGENLTKDFSDAKSAHIALMNSPSHRKNILNESYAMGGDGCYENICVEFFAGK